MADNKNKLFLDYVNKSKEEFLEEQRESWN